MVLIILGVLFILLSPVLAELWQESGIWIVSSKACAMPLPVPTACLLQAANSPERALPSLLSTSLQVPAVVR